MMTTAVAYPRLMPIDGCLHDFPTLTATVLPARMNDLEMAMTAPLPMSAFSTAGVGVPAHVDMRASRALIADTSGRAARTRRRRKGS